MAELSIWLSMMTPWGSSGSQGKEGRNRMD